MTHQQQQYSPTRPSAPQMQPSQSLPPLSQFESQPNWSDLPQVQEPPPRQRLPTRIEQFSEPGKRQRYRSSQHQHPRSPQSDVSHPRSPLQHGHSRVGSVLDAPLPPRIRELIDRIQPTPRTGPWDEAEDDVLLYFVDEGRNKNWVRISARMGFRTAKQCRERYFQSLRPDISHAACTEQEARFILAKVDEIGTRWAEIARAMGNRSDNWVKNWWNGQRNERSKAKAASLPPATGAGSAHNPGPLSPTRMRAVDSSRVRTAARARDSARATTPAENHVVQVPLPPMDASTFNRHYYPPQQQHQHWQDYSEEDMDGRYYHPCVSAAKPPASPRLFAEFRQSSLPSANHHQLPQQPTTYGYDNWRPSAAVPVGASLMESPSREVSPRPSPYPSHVDSPGSLDSSSSSLYTISSSAQGISTKGPSPVNSTTVSDFLLPHPSEVVASMADFDERQRRLRTHFAEHHQAAVPERRAEPMSLSNILN